MLAYVFWHRPVSGISDGDYRRPLAAFHEALRLSAPTGFQRSWVMHTEGASWLGSERRGYEDWYLVDGSQALDPLNEAAVSGLCKDSHDLIAQRATGGAGGLYRLHSGSPLPFARAVWLSKPAGMRYMEFYSRMDVWTTSESVTLWQRQMVLGPTSEFCLTSPSAITLPEEVAPVVTLRTLVWPI